MWADYLKQIQAGHVKSLARCISLVENAVSGYETLMQMLPASNTPIIGITGPPGAGKSTLTDALIHHWVSAGKRVGVLCVDPSSPFNLGALLGDRIRMSDWYNHPSVFIRSLATRGSLGGLHPRILEIADLMTTAPFDYVIVETVGVGQSEIEIAGLADTTLVVLVPEAGDEVQTMKAGLMEIAQLFVVNKADRPDADQFVHNLRLMLAPAFRDHAHGEETIPILKTVASHRTGIAELASAIEKQIKTGQFNTRRTWLLAEKAYWLIQQHRMQDIDKQALKQQLDALGEQVNLYRFIHQYL